MNKEFDFDDIGKKTPYRTPDNFFESIDLTIQYTADFFIIELIVIAQVEY